MVHLIVGYGEVGKGLHRVLGKAYYHSTSEGTWNGQKVDVVHICIPYNPKNPEIFTNVVKNWKEKSKLVIVHSSVPVGTCDELGVVHSPIRGVHPYLEEGIRVFVKYFGGEKAKEAAEIFENLGLETRIYEKARTTEALKLWDTTQYGVMIMLEKQIYKWCKENNVDFEAVYTKANKDYNAGYTALGRPEVVRPYLKHMDGPIGGHCVLPNARLLGKEFEFPNDGDL